MATYAGFAPGNYNAWALNLLSDVFCTPGVGRGLAVSAPGGMSVTVGVDAVAGDGVVVLPNGGWLRIDQAVTFTVSANSTGSTRNDAIVAFLDPTGVANPVYSLTYATNWAGGFTGNNNNQWVIATVAVPNGAVSIALANITMNPRVASFGGNKLLDPNTNVGIQVADLSGSNTTYIQSTATTPSSRNLVLQAMDSAGVGHNFTFDVNGSLTVPHQVALQNTSNLTQPATLYYVPTNNAVEYWSPQMGASFQTGHVFVISPYAVPFAVGNNYANASAWIDSGGNVCLVTGTSSIVFDALPTNGAGGYLNYMKAASAGGGNPGGTDLYIGDLAHGTIYLQTGTPGGSYNFQHDAFGNFKVDGAIYANHANYTVVLNGNSPTNQRIFTGTVAPTNATDGDIWVNA